MATGNFSDPDETLYWYCFRHSLPYSAYLRLKQEYAESPFREYSKKKWEVMNRSPKLFLLSEQNLKTYLSAMKAKGAAAYRREHAFSSFMELYERCRKVLCDMYNAEDFVTELDTPAPRNILPSTAGRRTIRSLTRRTLPGTTAAYT